MERLQRVEGAEIRIQQIITRIRERQREEELATGQSPQTLDKKNWIVPDSTKAGCPVCMGTGLVLQGADKGIETYTFCRCRKRLRAAAQWKRAGIDPEHTKLLLRFYTPYNEETKIMKNAAIHYLQYFGSVKGKRENSIAYLGQVGCGKTHLCAAIGINLIEKGVEVNYFSYRDAVVELKQNILNGEVYSKLIDRYKRAEVLIIDDLFKGKHSESDINILFEIINYRYLRFLPIILSSECTAEKLLAIDEAIGARLIEMCKSYTIETRGRENNFRLKQKSKGGQE